MKKLKMCMLNSNAGIANAILLFSANSPIAQVLYAADQVGYLLYTYVLDSDTFCAQILCHWLGRGVQNSLNSSMNCAVLEFDWKINKDEYIMEMNGFSDIAFAFLESKLKFRNQSIFSLP